MIDTAALGLALGAGLVAALNPCGFAFLPGYLMLVIAGGAQPRSQPAALTRAAAATVTMAAGFLTVFGVFGLLIAPLVVSAEKYLPLATIGIGVMLIGVGAWLLSGRDFTVLIPNPVGERAPGAGLRSMYGYGVAYATASLCCTIAPFLAVVGTAFQQGSVVTGLLAFLAYAAGMTITVGLAALAVALAGASAAAALRRVLPHINRIVGAVVLLTGLYVAYYGYYEARMFFTDSTPDDDPVIGAAAAVQGWLAGLVDAVGVWPLLAGLAALVALAAVRWPRRDGAARSD